MKFTKITSLGLAIISVNAAGLVCPKPTADEQKMIDAAKKIPGYRRAEERLKSELPGLINKAEWSLKT